MHAVSLSQDGDSGKLAGYGDPQIDITKKRAEMKDRVTYYTVKTREYSGAEGGSEWESR